MKQLIKSFQENQNRRGVHFYSSGGCRFLPWNEVCQFIESLNHNGASDGFQENLLNSLANYDPECEYLAVHQHGDSVSVELYSQVGSQNHGLG